MKPIRALGWLADRLGVGGRARRLRARLWSRAAARRARRFLGVGALLKNEAHILDEWLRHHDSEGVEHFYLIDNGSTDGPERVLAPWIASGKVTLVRDAARYDQVGHYKRHLPAALRECQWVAVIDLDEFVYARTGTVASFLRRLPGDVGAVKVPWKPFGSSGHVEQPPSVIDGFLNRGSYAAGEAAFYKSIVRSSAALRLDVHEHEMFGGYVSVDGAGREVAIGGGRIHVTEESLASSTLHLNHYRVQSRRWFESVKMTRGDSVGPEHEQLRDLAHFVRNDRNDVRDVELQKKRARSGGAARSGA
jgi:hypothetical protein